MVPVLLVALFVLVAVLSVIAGVDSRGLHDRQPSWPFGPRTRL
jgi:hypothetical protein